MLKRLLIPLILLGTVFVSAQERPLTRAEATNYAETSLYADVLDFIHQLQPLTPHMRVESMGQTAGGLDIPLLIIGDPVPVQPSDLLQDGRIPLYFQANIHAGEVEGKEAALMLIRDLLAEAKPRFLDRFVLLVAPIFNADGNDQLSPNNRRDNGPELAGIRYNGWNLDLNRDGMKQESPEMRALMDRVFLRWDPLLFVDCHTTNGSYHDEPVTYLWPANPNGDEAIIDYMVDRMMPDIRKRLKKEYNTLSIPYGNYRNPRKPEEGWVAAGAEPRYLTNYYGLRNRFSILLENYAYADFKTRVWGNYHFLLSVLEYCDAHLDEMRAMTRQADLATIRRGQRPSETDSFAVAFKEVPLGRSITIQGYELDEIKDERGRMRLSKSDRKAVYEVPLFHRYVATQKVRMPAGYLIQLNDPAVIENLLGHGILVEQLEAELKMEVEAFQITEVQPATNPYGGGVRSNQGHYLNTVQGKTQNVEKVFSPGTFYVPTGQPLGDLAAYLLEPQSDDGLLLWNFFDRYITAQWGRQALDYPVYKCYEPVTAPRRTVERDR